MIEDWALAGGHEVTVTRLFENESLPLPAEVDLLVLMGGPMSVGDVAGYPWLEREKLFIEDFLRLDRPALGVCLGAQLLAEVLGGTVVRNAQPEIGWFSVRKCGSLPIPWPEEVQVFHWHGDTFSIPPDAIRICESEFCKNQAFLWDNRVLGLQFHLEMKPKGVAAIVEKCSIELVESASVQPARILLSKPEGQFVRLHTLMNLLLDFLASRTGRCS